MVRRPPRSTLFPSRRSSDLINRGTTATGHTTIGQRCFLMSYVHIAHDCVIGNDVIMANAVQMAGHVSVDRSEEHTSELQSQFHLVCRLLLEKKKSSRSTHTI